MEGQGRPASSGRGAEARAAGTGGWGYRSPCQQEAWPGPTRRSHASEPHPAGEVGPELPAEGKGQGVFPSLLPLSPFSPLISSCPLPFASLLSPAAGL